MEAWASRQNLRAKISRGMNVRRVRSQLLFAQKDYEWQIRALAAHIRTRVVAVCRANKWSFEGYEYGGYAFRNHENLIAREHLAVSERGGDEIDNLMRVLDLETMTGRCFGSYVRAVQLKRSR